MYFLIQLPSILSLLYDTTIQPTLSFVSSVSASISTLTLFLSISAVLDVGHLAPSAVVQR